MYMPFFIYWTEMSESSSVNKLHPLRTVKEKKPNSGNLFGYFFFCCCVVHFCLQETGLRNTYLLDISYKGVAIFVHRQGAQYAGISATSCKTRTPSPSTKCLAKAVLFP